MSLNHKISPAWFWQEGIKPFPAVGCEQFGGGAHLLCLHPKRGVVTAAPHLLPPPQTHHAAAGCQGHKHSQLWIPGKSAWETNTQRFLFGFIRDIKRCFLLRRSLQTLWPLQSSMFLVIWLKTDTKPSYPVSRCTIVSEKWLFHLLMMLVVLTSRLDPETRVILKSTEEDAGPDRYINANYIRVSLWYYSDFCSSWEIKTQKSFVLIRMDSVLNKPGLFFYLK